MTTVLRIGYAVLAAVGAVSIVAVVFGSLLAWLVSKENDHDHDHGSFDTDASVDTGQPTYTDGCPADPVWYEFEQDPRLRERSYYQGRRAGDDSL